MKRDLNEFRVGEQDNSGETIDELIASSSQVVVYFVADGVLKLETAAPDPSDTDIAIFREYDAIHSLIRRSIPDKHARPFKKELGSTMYSALSDGGKAQPKEFFEDVKAHVLVRSAEIARYYYFLSGITVCVLFVGIVVFIYDAHRLGITGIPTLLLGAVGGAVGALASILMRARTLEVTPYAHWESNAIQGTVRILLGAVFGFILVAAVKGEILLSILRDQKYGLLAFSILSGFSEKYVPDILATMEKRKERDNRWQH